MGPPKKPVEILLYQDVLCAWCYVAERRLAVIRRELGDAVEWKTRPYALLTQDKPLTNVQRKEWMREVDEARKEPEGALLTTALWTGELPPRSSLPALAALEAARLQGPNAHERLAVSMQRAALEAGLDVGRSDVVFELASRVGLNLAKFEVAWQSEELRRMVLDAHQAAEERGVKGVPTLVVAGRFMLSGLREVSEYRKHLLESLGRVEQESVERLLH